MFEAGDHLNPSGLLQQQRADEIGRHYAQDVLDSEMRRTIDNASEPFFVIMATPGLRGPLDSRAHHRGRVYATRGSQLAAAAGCPWHDQWATAANPAQCSANARDTRFEREAMAVAVDDSIGLAVERLTLRGLWNRTLMIFMSDNGGLLAQGATNRPLRGGKNSFLEGGIHVRAALGGGYLPMQLHTRSSRTIVHLVDFYPTLSALAGLTDPYDDPLATAHGVAAQLPVDGRNILPSWRLLYTSTAANASAPTDELVSATIADWCPGSGDNQTLQQPSPAPASPLLHPSPPPCVNLTAASVAPLPNETCAATPTVGLLKRTNPAPGYVLYAPRLTTDVYLLDVRRNHS